MKQSKLSLITFLLVLFLFIHYQNSEAKEINLETAQKAAASWFQSSIAFNKASLQKTVNLPITNTGDFLENNIVIKDNFNQETLAYVIKLNPQGFIIVSPNTDIFPVIAYSTESQFNPEPSNQNILLQDF